MYITNKLQNAHLPLPMNINKIMSAVPTYSYTDSSPSEFCDELLRRGIVNDRQVLLSKGMDEDAADAMLEARELKKVQKSRMQGMIEAVEELELTRWRKGNTDKDNDDSDCTDRNNVRDGDSDLSDDEDPFLEKYRSMRISEMKRQQIERERLSSINAGGSFGFVTVISRTDWTREVNEASLMKRSTDCDCPDKDSDLGATVVVHLTSSHIPLSSIVSAALRREIAPAHRFVKFVEIPAHEAVEGYPINDLSKLPALFVYRNGQCCFQLIGDRKILGNKQQKFNEGEFLEEERIEILTKTIVEQLQRYLRKDSSFDHNI
uniref:Phosducin thioredoxin-like domain-containing protein n=1 Tax=Corethron hystrix TaxID=216773 RepID=A0A7S1FVZ3_9STRA|mmetsp:Transcript_33731/g.77854  ORF Transcript_33731/g.77854 Transcript_33731/m.77854 type:complete len:319 (+) Transcript_33731:58-1014(+)